jgi:caspase domain-containing protein
VNTASDTWALVVGVDAYHDPNVPNLTGAVADAVAVAEWLRNLGVPKRQILLHAAPTDRSAPLLSGWRRRRATGDAIDESIVLLSNHPGAERLIVYLAGHGIFEPTAGRLFLLPPFTPETPTNLGIDKHIQRFLSMRFRRQFLFMDGCQNRPYSQAVRQRIEGVMYGGATGFTPQPGNVLVTAFAAAQGELAYEVGGHGAFTRRLLEGLSLAHPWPDAVVLDFQTGTRGLDLRELITGYVAKQVKADVAPNRQTVLFAVQPGESGDRSLFFSFTSDQRPGEVNVTVQPAHAARDVARLRIAVRDHPLWAFADPMPPREDVGVPLAIRMPCGVAADAYCVLKDDAPWEGTLAHSFEVGDSQDLVFTLDPPTELSDTTVEIRPVTPRGALASRRFLSHRIADLPGFDDPSGQALAAGLWFEETDTGHRFRLTEAPESLGPGIEYATEWADAMLSATDAEIGIETIVRTDHSRLRPEVHVVPPPEGVTRLAGPLVDRRLLWIGPPEQAPTWPLFDPESGERPTAGSQALSELPPDGRWFEVEPGTSLVRLDLPWGSWSTVVQSRPGQSVTVELPSSVGDPPLRVRLADQLARRGTLLLGASDRPGPLLLSTGLSGPERPELADVRPASARWAASASRVGWFKRPGSIGIATAGDFSFPLLHGRTLALEQIGEELIVEPLSAVDSPAWDVLLVGGHLDGLSPATTVELTSAKWRDPLLGLAGAYAVYALPTGPMVDRYLATVTRNLARLGGAEPRLRVPDITLLKVALMTRRGRSIPDHDLSALERWANQGALPVLRWGVPLAITLAEPYAHRNPSIARWVEQLREIETNLSAASVWTVWRRRTASRL